MIPRPTRCARAKALEVLSLHQSLSEGTSDLMQFHANTSPPAKAGDYYQVSFDTEDPGEDSTDPRGPDRPYLIIQRQFETLDGGQCYVETHDHGYVGHFHVRLTNFTRTCLAFEIARNVKLMSKCPAPWTRWSSRRCSAS